MSAKALRPVIPAVALGVGAVAVWARFIEPAWIDTTFTELDWNGPDLRLVLLTDLHVRPGGERRTQRIVRRTNALDPDLVLIGGDFIDGLEVDLRKLSALRPLDGLRARLGVYGVLGNHDGHDGPEGDNPIRRTVEDAGVRILGNENVEHDGAFIVGLGDRRMHEVEPSSAFRGVPTDAPTIVLAHGPKALEVPGMGRFDLALAGHTHGGQGCIPFTHVCPYLEDDMKPWVKGLYDWPKGGRLYVSRGLGTSGHPARIGARPEMACIDLATSLRASPRSRSNRRS
jgi:predicted MPP superfamily phosphohydrolase